MSGGAILLAALGCVAVGVGGVNAFVDVDVALGGSPRRKWPFAAMFLGAAMIGAAFA